MHIYDTIWALRGAWAGYTTNSETAHDPDAGISPFPSSEKDTGGERRSCSPTGFLTGFHTSECLISAHFSHSAHLRTVSFLHFLLKTVNPSGLAPGYDPTVKRVVIPASALPHCNVDGYSSGSRREASLLV